MKVVIPVLVILAAALALLLFGSRLGLHGGRPTSASGLKTPTVLVVTSAASPTPMPTSPLDGTIQFGSSLSGAVPNDPVIVAPKSTFHARDTIAWVAHFSAPIGLSHVTQQIAKKLDFSGELIVVTNPNVPTGSGNSASIHNQLSVSVLQNLGVKVPGSYIMRYLDGKTVLAHGSFRLVP